MIGNAKVLNTMDLKLSKKDLTTFKLRHPLSLALQF